MVHLVCAQHWISLPFCSRSFNAREVPCFFKRPHPTDPPGYGPVDDIDTYVDEYLLRLGDGNIQEYVRQYQLGFTVGRDDYSGASMFTVWYNNQVRTKWSRHVCARNVFMSGTSKQ